MNVVDEVRRRIVEYTATWTRLGYSASNSDDDHDGIANRADLQDRDGVDCSGWAWCIVCMLAAFGCYLPGLPEFWLGSTATYTARARANGWVLADRKGQAAGLVGVPLQPGDMVIYDKYRDPDNSGGPRGHVGIVEHVEGRTVYTSESRGGQGVGIYPRDASFWCFAIRIPLRTNLVTFDQPPPPPPKYTSQEYDMPTCHYPPIGQTHRWFIPKSGPRKGHLCHVWVATGARELGFEDMCDPRSQTAARPFTLGLCDPEQPPDVMIDPVDLGMAVGFVGADGNPNRISWAANGPWRQIFAKIV